MFERALLAAASTATTAVVGTAEPLQQYGWIGALMPSLIGVIMVIISRTILDMNATKKRAWNYNLMVITLCSIFTGVFVHELKLTAGGACLFGMAIGAMGVGIIGLGKPMLDGVIEAAYAKWKSLK